MIHPDTQLRWIDDHIGFGVFATAPIPVGTVLVAPDPLDQRISRKDFEQLPSIVADRAWHFMYHDEQGQLVLSWDHARYLNHACQANSLLTQWGFEIVVRPILTGDEVTTDYGALRLTQPVEMGCQCTPCRVVIGPDDPQMMGELWGEMIAEALLRAPHLPQPLEACFSPRQRAILNLNAQ